MQYKIYLCTPHTKLFIKKCIPSFLHSWPITGFVIRVNLRILLVEWNRNCLSDTEHLNSPPPGFCGVHIVQSLGFITVFCRSYVSCFIVGVYLHCRWRSNYQHGEGWEHINRFTSAICVCMSQTKSRISNIICWGPFYVQRVQVRGYCSFCW